MKTMSFLGFGALFSLLFSTALSASAQEPATITGNSDLPQVRVWASSWKTSEPCPLCRVIPGEFTFERSVAGKEPLTVFFRVDGTATSGEDYQEMPNRVEIPAGELSATLLVAPMDDLLAEGPEVVRVVLLPPPVNLENPYRIMEHGREALVAIGDDEPEAPVARLDIVEPMSGATLRTPSVVPLEAIVVWSEGEVQDPVEFFAGDHLIGRSPGVPVLRPVIPCLPSVQRVFWTNPPAGEHVITARAPLLGDRKLVSPPIRVRVLGEPELPVVRIEATSRIAEESSFPFRRLQFEGLLTISRTGPTDFSLPVFVHYSGTASPEDFHTPPPWLVSIPAGESSVEIRLVAYPDDIPEGIETLVATLSNCPPDTDPPMGIPCYGFDIDPAHASATIFLRDDGITRATVELTRPQDGDHFRPGTTIPIAAVAIDLESYISRLEFFDGERRIGVSEIYFFVAPDPGTPIHHLFEWVGAEVGRHVITARAVVSESLSVTSAPVHITVGDVVNAPPRVAIVCPETGASFPPLTSIEIVAEAVDPDGVVRKVAFYANDRKIGETGWETDRVGAAGEPRRFAFVWREPMPGDYHLTARAVDNSGAVGVSSAVEIHVNPPVDLPVVMVKAVDPFAVEPSPDLEHPNTATFLIRRFGGVEQDLAVRYSLRGSAENGVDYEMLSGWARMPAGQRSVPVVIQPLVDDLREGVETVVLRLEESAPSNTDPAGSDHPAYRIGYRGRAVALISDQPWHHDLGRGRCLPLTGGFMHICFAAIDGDHVRVEASSDMRRWETVHEAVAADGAVHFIDEECGEFPQRFYRVEQE